MKNPSPLIWVGGKARLLPALLEYLPQTPNRYFEPFCGGASLFFAYGYQARGQVYLNDICHPLMNVYEQLANNREYLLSLVEELGKGSYEQIKADFNEIKLGLTCGQEWMELHAMKYAALFICLNKMCFNGVYRENKKGEFNVPVGRNSKKERNTCDNLDYDKFRFCGRLLQGVVLKSQSFSPWPFDATPSEGDVVFYDPPYLKEFSGYNKDGFTADHHILLAAQAGAIAKRGATVIVCGSNNAASREIYGEPTRIVSLQRTVGNFSQSYKKRGKAEEALWVYNAAKK